MLKCERCGAVYFTAASELFQQCESCGEKLIDITPEKKKEEEKEFSEIISESLASGEKQKDEDDINFQDLCKFIVEGRQKMDQATSGILRQCGGKGMEINTPPANPKTIEKQGCLFEKVSNLLGVNK